MDAQGETESIDTFLQRMLHNYQDINEDEFMVSEKILVAATIFNLNNKLSGARASIIAALDARQSDLAAASIPFTQLSTMLVHHHSHTTFLGHHHHGQRHGMHGPRAFNSAIEVVVDEALFARADSSHRRMRTPPPCCYCTEANLPLVERLHWHQDCPLLLQPSHHQDQKPLPQ
jgi:hypothetical protein